MEQAFNKRAEQTRKRLREAAHRLFLQQGYQATSIEAILAEAGISSKETLYRYYDNKGALFVDVLSHLTIEQPDFVETLGTLPTPCDLPSLHQALTHLFHGLVAMLIQPGYLPLVQMVLTESGRFPQVSTLFFSTVTQSVLSLVQQLLQAARERQVIADLDLMVVTQILLGGLITSVLMSTVVERNPDQLAILKRVDAVIAVTMRALQP